MARKYTVIESVNSNTGETATILDRVSLAEFDEWYRVNRPKCRSARVSHYDTKLKEVTVLREPGAKFSNEAASAA